MKIQRVVVYFPGTNENESVVSYNVGESMGVGTVVQILKDVQAGPCCFDIIFDDGGFVSLYGTGYRITYSDKSVIQKES